MCSCRPQRGSAKVLCVDPETYLTDLLHYALTRFGYAVLTATRGVEAWKIAEHWSPDAAILEVDLPDLHGPTLGAWLRERYGTVVILLTARYVENEIVSRYSWGADECLVKPFHLRILMCRLQTDLQQRVSRANTSGGADARIIVKPRHSPTGSVTTDPWHNE